MSVAGLRMRTMSTTVSERVKYIRRLRLLRRCSPLCGAVIRWRLLGKGDRVSRWCMLGLLHLSLAMNSAPEDSTHEEVFLPPSAELHPAGGRPVAKK